MGITSRNPGRVWYGTLAEFEASPSLRKKGDVCLPTDSEELRICNGVDAFADLLSLPYGQAAAIAALGTTTALTALVPAATNLTASNLTAAIPSAPTKAEVDAGIDVVASEVETALGLKADNDDVETLRTQAEARLDAIEAKVDAFLAAVKAAGLMAS